MWEVARGGREEGVGEVAVGEGVGEEGGGGVGGGGGWGEVPVGCIGYSHGDACMEGGEGSGWGVVV